MKRNSKPKRLASRRRANPEAILAWGVMVMAASAVAVLRAEHMDAAARERKSHSFQRLVQGLGLGPLVDFGAGAAEFDPRLGAREPFGSGPVPLGSGRRVNASLSVFPLRSLASGDRDETSL